VLLKAVAFIVRPERCMTMCYKKRERVSKRGEKLCERRGEKPQSFRTAEEWFKTRVKRAKARIDRLTLKTLQGIEEFGV
jgi:hypothetical protein